MTNNYTLNINCVILSTDISQNKQYVLSLSKDDIVFPSFSLNEDFLKNIDGYIIGYIKKYLFVSDMELLPQLINISSQVISNSVNTVDIIYGFIVGYNPSISHDAFWFEFDYQIPNKYSNLLFEVTQKLK